MKKRNIEYRLTFKSSKTMMVGRKDGGGRRAHI